MSVRLGDLQLGLDRRDCLATGDGGDIVCWDAGMSHENGTREPGTFEET